MKKKGYDPFKETMDVGLVGVGSVGVVGITGHIAGRMPHHGAGTSSSIIHSMDTIKILPTMKATGSVFGSLRHLEKKVKK